MARRRHTPIDVSQVKTVGLTSQKHKVSLSDLARVGKAGLSFMEFMDNLPNQLAAKEFKEVARAIVDAHRGDKPVIWALGAHVIKCGLSPLIVELMKRGVVSAIALNGAGCIHDVEIALVGETSEDVAEELGKGSFGMAAETAQVVNEALYPERGGMGELIGRRLIELKAPHRQHSLLAQGVELGVPVTVHVALGTDTVHMHPNAQGEAIGRASLFDFRLLAGIVANLGSGGVFLNVGSTVVLPEVFLKALALARNIGHEVSDFVTVNLDMQQHYRPLQNVVRRPTAASGRGYALTGHHELMLPLLVQLIIERLESGS